MNFLRKDDAQNDNTTNLQRFCFVPDFIILYAVEIAKHANSFQDTVM